MYRDRRSNEEVDASKAIWILATNLGDTVVERFHTTNFAGKSDLDVLKISLTPLRDSLMTRFPACYTIR